MPADERYRSQVALLVRVLPLIAQEECFALKGGTAINLFIRNLPRLSVDIDLAYLPVSDREESLRQIQAALRRIEDRIAGSFPSVRVQRGMPLEEGVVNKLFVRDGVTQIKIEVTPVLRGCVGDAEVRGVAGPVEEKFGYAEIQVVSFADLYAGKITAALDRQHPRDLFDVRDLLLNEGIDTSLRCAFVVYLISHHRSIHRLLAPPRRDMGQEYERGLAGMMEVPVPLHALEQAREDMVAGMVGEMPEEHRRFLLSFQLGTPEWQLLEVPHAENLPAVRWRMMKWAKLEGGQRQRLADQLRSALEGGIRSGTTPASANLEK